MHTHKDLAALPAFQNAVVTIGSFDGVHTGHRRILDRVAALARQCGGESVVLTFEPHPRAVLQPHDERFRLITTTEEKLELLKQAGVNHTVLVPFSKAFAEQTAEQYVNDFLVRLFHPRYIVIGYDHRFGKNRQGDIHFLRQYEVTHGFEVVEIPAQEVEDIAVSSTKIRQAIESADIVHANRLLGHPFSFSGTVVEGKQIGRTIGFPTANVQINDPHKLIPPPGIYAAIARCAQGIFNAMLYIGNRPTIQNDHRGLTIEVNLLHFNGDLYGQNLSVDVHDFIRPDKTLHGLAELQAQIEQDKTVIQQRLTPHAPHPTPRTPQEIAVVILNYNTRRHLETFLPSVIKHSPGARILVADNGSPDDSVAFLHAHYPDVEVLNLQTNHGFAQGYNVALEQVQADVYVILNSDVEVSAGWMQPILEAMAADPTIAVAQPKIMAWNEKDRFEYAGAAGGWIDYLGYPFCRGRIFNQRETDYGQYDTPQRCFWAAGAAFFIRAELYHAFGGFDGDYFAHNEEIDLCWRLQRAGYSVWCIPQSVVYHLGGGTLEYESPRKVYLNFRNSLFSLLKNEPWGKLLWLIPARLLLDGLAAVRFLAKGQFTAIRSIVQAHFSFYGQWSKTVEKRRTAEAVIEKHRIGPEERRGIYKGSIVFAHYAKRLMRYSEL
ncbi:MAG: riboflavin biosynthesis protein RibF [Saprospiraceae bacterium]